MNGLIAAAILFGLVGLIEIALPARDAKRARWPRNLAWGFATMAATRLASVAAPLAAARWAAQNGLGLFNQIAIPQFALIIASVIFMDCAVYWQHRAFHRVTWFWRWHKLHHADQALDVTTAVRFHPIEGLISLVWKSAFAAALGIPIVAVPLFEFWLMAGSLIEHANIRLPRSIEYIVRSVLVTPAMHRIHHSAHDDDAQHNFGFAISAWDRVFRSYQSEPSGLVIGLPGEA